MTIQLRRGRSEDLKQITAFDQIAQSDPQRVTFIEEALDSKQCLVAEHGAVIIAYGVLEYSFFDNGFISMIYVAPAARRLGVGSLLVNALAEQCITPKLFTSINRSNVSMQQLLERLNFISSGIIYNLDPGDPELIYFLDRQKELKR